MSNKAVLLVNLGSPDSTSIPDVKRYLREFLMDERVINKGELLRKFVVGLILRRRPAATAEAYGKIWTEEGSPLVATSEKVRGLTESRLGDVPVYLAMRYANPSLPDVVDGMLNDGVEDLFVIPLYPHYAASSFETAVVRLEEVIRERGGKIRTTVLSPFYGDEDYLEALVATSEKDLATDYDHLLISFHGVPLSHLRQADSTRSHCLAFEDCCYRPNPCHATCYRHQSIVTAERFAEKAGVPADKWSFSFQSRIGREPWMEPYTSDELPRLAREGVKKLLVLCPAFVTDCLETLEEISMEGKQDFLQSGGESFKQIPCLNDHPKWIDFLAGRSQAWLDGAH